MHRREFLKTTASMIALAGTHASQAEPKQIVMTVMGPISPETLGVTLAHEHVLVDFIGADKVSRDRYDADRVFSVALPHLKRVQELGCRTLVECTPAYLGRDPALLRRLANASGLNILTNTGYYGAVRGKYLPAHAHTESADQLAARWFSEWQHGIGDTGVRPGFIKIGVDAGPLNEMNRKLVQAAARTHLKTGLTIAAHTGDGTAALEELEILRDEGAEASSFIWVHAQSERDTNLHSRAAELGAWVEFDGIGPDTVPRHVELVKSMKERGHLARVLLSHDAGWYHVGEPEGGNFRPYDTLFTKFRPALDTAGFTPEDFHQLTITNPRRAFMVLA